MSLKKIELLAPARDYQTGIVAIEHGADAVYIGAPKFGARQAAGNSIEQIARLVEYGRGFGVKVYATLNTIVFENELKEAEQMAREVIAAGVDALIVQDMAYMRMGLWGEQKEEKQNKELGAVESMMPLIERHSSTQMCNITPEGVRFLQESGFSRVILERGLTLEQIREIRAATDIELESFVHGSICVGHSGRCYLSRTMSQRSGNRGECSQPCRLTYDLEDERGNVIMAGKHLLSVKDMNLTERVPDLIDAGVTSFKIEGRLKTQEYVKNVVAHYNTVINKALEQREGYKRSSSGSVILDFEPDPSRSFTRGGTHWMLDGKMRGVASFDTPKAVGAPMGRVKAVGAGWFEMEGVAEMVGGDGVCFFVDGKLEGTNINRVEAGRVFPNRMEGISKGVELFRNYDKAFTEKLERSKTRRVVDVEAVMTVEKEYLKLSLTDEDGVSVDVDLRSPFEMAKDAMRMAETIRTQVAKTGDTIFNLSNVLIMGDAQLPFVPIAVINGMRREATDRLLEKRRDVMSKHDRKQAAENRAYPYPQQKIGGEYNVVNSLAEQFYRDHGVTEIERGLDLNRAYDGEQVMITPYCIRRELGECLLEDAKYRGELYLRRGRHTYHLGFDCKACLMTLRPGRIDQ